MASRRWFDQRVIAGVSAVIRWSATDQDGTAADPDGAVTVTVTRADGTAVVTGASAAGSGGTAWVYSASLTATNVGSAPDQLTAVWSVADVVRASTVIDVAGGIFFTSAQARASDPTLLDAAKYPDEAIAASRVIVEQECEWICGAAFVPRFARVTLNGSGDGRLVLPDGHVRTVRSASIDGTALDSPELAALQVLPDRTLVRTDGAAWARTDLSAQNVVVAYEYGWDRPPQDLVEATLWRLLDLLNTPIRNRVMDRATRMTSDNGVSYDLATPGLYSTGMPAVDARYARYSERAGSQGETGGTIAPASRAFDFDPQYYGLFHGGRR